MAQYKKPTVKRKGLTIIELMLASGISAIVILGFGMLLVDSHRGWNRMYSRTYSDVVNDAHAARRRFDSVVRSASNQGILLDEFGAWVEVYYYSDPNVADLDSYARFYTSDNGTEKQLMIEYGELDPRQTLITETLCGNVSSCIFKTSGNSVQMILSLDDGSQSTTVVASAVLHNL
jgi:hypothetical protein